MTSVREQYLLDPDIIFLNHGSFGACPAVVFEQYQQWQRELERQPVEFLGRRYDVLLREARDTLADFVGTAGDNLIFVPNATAGLNTVARSLQLNPGDEILTTTHEYGALNHMWQYISQQTGAKVIQCELPLPVADTDELIEVIWSGITDRTRILFLSHITSSTALILPVRKLCKRARAAGILTVIDGAHVPGHLPLDLDTLGADFYSGNCHKWLSAPKGSAFLYAHPDHHALLDPLTISWGWDGNTLFERTRWQGTRDIAAYLSVPDAIRFQQQHHWRQLAIACHNLAVDTMHHICEITKLAPLAKPRFFGQMVAVPLPPMTTNNAAVLKARLYDDYRIEIPLTTLNDQHFIRVSLAAYNQQADVDALISALRDLL